MPLKTLKPKDVTVTFGPLLISGYMDGSMIEINQVNPDYVAKQGIDLVSMVESYDGFYTVTVNLQQTSDTVTALDVIRQAGLISPGRGVQPLTIKDLNGVTSQFSPAARIEKDPDNSINKSEINGRSYTFLCVDMSGVTGGNF